MTRTRGGTELVDYVEEVRHGHQPRRRVAVHDEALLASSGAVAAQAILVLIHRRRENGDAVERADSLDAGLRNANCRRSSEGDYLVGTVSAVAVHASGMAVVDEH